LTPTCARLTLHWRISPWFTLQPSDTSAAVFAGGLGSDGGTVAIRESYQSRQNLTVGVRVRFGVAGREMVSASAFVEPI
jgi:hypothetical protein